MYFRLCFHPRVPVCLRNGAPEDCGGDRAESESAGASELETLATQISALPLSEERTASLANVAVAAAKRMKELEKGWNMCQKKRLMQGKYLGQIQDLYSEDYH